MKGVDLQHIQSAIMGRRLTQSHFIYLFHLERQDQLPCVPDIKLSFEAAVSFEKRNQLHSFFMILWHNTA